GTAEAEAGGVGERSSLQGWLRQGRLINHLAAAEVLARDSVGGEESRYQGPGHLCGRRRSSCDRSRSEPCETGWQFHWRRIRCVSRHCDEAVTVSQGDLSTTRSGSGAVEFRGSSGYTDVGTLTGFRRG